MQEGCVTASPWKRSRQARRQDPIAPVRRRPNRIAKKLAKRHGMLRARGFSVERTSRIMATLVTAQIDCAKAMSNMGREFVRVVIGVDMAKPGTRDRTVIADMGTPWHRGFWDETSKP